MATKRKITELEDGYVEKRSDLPDKIKLLLWTKSAGRCAYSGCNKVLYEDPLTLKPSKIGYIAHIVASSPNGPRGDKRKSKELEKEYCNLILLCDPCHKRIDINDPENNTVEKLIKMKNDHENKIEIITSIGDDRKSQIVIYTSNIANSTSQINYQIAGKTIIDNNYYPKEDVAIILGISNSSQNDKTSQYWDSAFSELESNFNEKVISKIRNKELPHISLFAIAPMPLLVKLGTLLTDLNSVEVYQKHKNPDSWNWQNDSEEIKYIISKMKPKGETQNIALNISLSANINNSDIYKTLGNNTYIYTITISNPYNDFLRSKKDLLQFGNEIAKLFNAIKKEQGDSLPINIFPSMPISTSILLGQRWNKKCDLQLVLYDKNSGNTFNRAIEIKNT